VIPYGRTAADATTAANILGISLRTFNNKRAKMKLPPLLSRTRARHQLWDYQQLTAALAGEDISPLPEQPEHPRDLLDAEEARLTIPEEQRPTTAAWSNYLTGKSAPEPDAMVCDAVPHYRRGRVPELLAERPAPGGAPGRGRTKGAADKGERHLTALVHQRAAQRRDRTRELLQQASAAGVDLFPADVALELEVTIRHAERLIADARHP
jgi:hypothetical protein